MSYMVEQGFSAMDTEFKQLLNQAGLFNYEYLRGSWPVFRCLCFPEILVLPLNCLYRVSVTLRRVSYDPMVMFGTCCSLLLLNSCSCTCQSYLTASSKSLSLHSFYLAAIYLISLIGFSLSLYTGAPGIGYHYFKN